MSDDTSTEWTLNLDTEGAESGLEVVKTGLQEIGATDLTELGERLAEVGSIVGVVGLSIYALKEAMDAVFEGEQIAAVNKQFETLAENAGLAGDKLKEGLEKASGGLINETDLLKLANKGILELGQNAEHLDQVMSVARQAAAVTGHDVSEVFAQMTQAIATGQTRMLRSTGVIIDQNKAYKDYAASIGVATSELTKEGRQHAVLNALLAKSKDDLADIDPNIKQATNAFQAFKVAMSEIGETISLVFAKAGGPILKEFFNNLAGWAGMAKKTLQAEYGEGADAAKAKVEVLTQKLQDQRAAIVELGSKYAQLDATTKGGDIGKSLQASIERANMSVLHYKIELNKAQEAYTKLAPEAEATDAKITQSNEINTKERLKNLQKLQEEVDKMQAKTLKEEITTATSVKQVEQAAAQYKILVNKTAQDEIDKLKQKMVTGDAQRNKLISAQIVEVEKQKTMELKKLDLDLEAARIKSLENYAAQTTSVTKGIAASWKAQCLAAGKELRDFNNLGKVSFQAVGQNAQSAFLSIGQGAQSAGDAMKGFMLNSLADIAQAQGALAIATGIATLDPIPIAGGAALLVLSGALRAAAGGAGSSSSSVSSISTSGDGGASLGGTTTATSPNSTPAPTNSGPSTTQQQQKSVNFVVQGNLYSSNQAKTEMMDLMRQATDATDYKYTQVGGPNQ